MSGLIVQQLVNGLALGGTYALVALGLTLVFGVLLVPNFAHGDLFMLGGFVSWSLTAAGLNFWAALPLAMAAAGLAGVALDRVAFRPLAGASGLTLMIAALGASIILQQGATLLWGTEPRTTPRPIPGVQRTGLFIITNHQIVLLATLGLVWAGLRLLLQRTRLGLAIRAMAQNREAALLMGIRLERVRAATFFIGAAVGGLAGALLGASFPIHPDMGVEPVLKAFVVLVLGGVGSLPGAVLGGLFLGVMEVMVAGFVSSELKNLGAFLILVLALILRPHGLFGRAEVER